MNTEINFKQLLKLGLKYELLAQNMIKLKFNKKKFL